MTLHCHKLSTAIKMNCGTSATVNCQIPRRGLTVTVGQRFRQSETNRPDSGSCDSELPRRRPRHFHANPASGIGRDDLRIGRAVRRVLRPNESNECQ
jgi:hypothetical protein